MFCAGPDGEPMTQEPDPLSPEQVAATERAWRGSQLDATDALVQRHRDELEDGANTTLSAGQYQELQAYRRSLREWPETEASRRQISASVGAGLVVPVLTRRPHPHCS